MDDEPIKIPLEYLYISLYKEFKKEQAKNEAQAKEIEKLKNQIKLKVKRTRDKQVKNNAEVNQKLFEYKLSDIHRSMTEELQNITRERDKYKKRCEELLKQK